MKYAIGSPPFDVFSIMDTGSDLTWMQCNPCTQCYQQNAPIFDPKSSSTYTDINCQSTQCQQIRIHSCGAANVCSYSTRYQDLSFSNGNLAADSITFNSTDERSLQFFNFTFGCGHGNGGSFRSDTSGVIGLGGGPLSLVSQLKSAMSGKFSYCLVSVVDSHLTTTVNFGSNAVVSGDGAVSTPLVDKQPPTYYYVTLNGITVGPTRIHYKSSSPNNVNADVNEGNIVVDSGTTITFLPPDMYDQLESTFTAVIQGKRAPSPVAPLKLCYYLSKREALNIPHLTFHFEGADVPLFPANVFVRVSDGVVCCSMAPAPAGAPNIYGNLAQVNYLVGYDVVNRQITFKPTVCSLH
ncbi:Xylanase inhibitor, C-terminal [Dillenia turbinata]|uniref:Xylanase inhibitor, C-terminal n=1 Tax=Dillenia turbinata TaxID=194707 RepID=A0AAN8WEJ6_9MAGN